LLGYPKQKWIIQSQFMPSMDFPDEPSFLILLIFKACKYQEELCGAACAAVAGHGMVAVELKRCVRNTLQ
jgi:hypothetical protein